MTLNDRIKQAELNGILEGDADLPDVTGDFHLTVDGVPLCIVDRALAGELHEECQYRSLNYAFLDCLKLQELFPAATVGVFLGECPNGCAKKAA